MFEPGSKLTHIEAGAFDGCSSLESTRVIFSVHSLNRTFIWGRDLWKDVVVFAHVFLVLILVWIPYFVMRWMGSD
jgi:hypothetical protein